MIMPNRPYRGLAPYLQEDAALFVGRDSEIAACCERVLHFDYYVFILHGQSGTGKSSFLRAGLLPHLGELQRLELGSPETKFSDLYGTIVVRSGTAPLIELAGALWDRIDLLLKAPTSAGIRKDHLDKARDIIGERSAFLKQAGESHEPVYLAIRSLTRLIPTRFNLVIDQLEEVFFASHSEANHSRAELFRLLFRIANEKPHMRLLIGMRTEYKAKLDEELDAQDIDRGAVGSYQLMPISREGLLQAILQPSNSPLGDAARGLPPNPYKFAFEPGLAEIIQRDLVADGMNPSIWLPVMQVICDRLYGKVRQASDEVSVTIGPEQYRAAGACSAQVTSHLDEKIVQGLRAFEQREQLAEQADRWKAVLLTCVRVDSDGHITAGAPVSHTDLVSRAEHNLCVEIERMLEWLAREENYILQRVSMQMEDGQPGWRLIHDILAASIVEWHHSERRHRDVPMPEADPLLQTAHESYLQWTGPIKTFSTLNDLIWDHQIALFAQSRGFSQRLGFVFRVEEEFDLTQRKGQMDYAAFVSDARKHSHRMLILPLFMLDELNITSWNCVGVPNIYRGYAVLGPQRDGLDSLHGWRREAKSPEEAEALLDSLAAELADPARTVAVFEDKSLEFVNLLLEMTGRERRRDIRILGVTGDGKQQTASRDILFSELVASRVDFALGPAPSRALAEQAGFVVYADFEDVRGLAEPIESRLQAEGHKPMHLGARLTELLMPEGWMVDVPPDEHATLLRLTALMFYTVDYIRRSPEEFVSFLYDQCLLAQDDDAFWLQRNFIRRAVASCYEYHASADYSFTMAAVPQCSGQGSASIYVEWLKLRAECDLLIPRLLLVPESAWPLEVKERFRHAKKNYRIYNYFDAEAGFRAALQGLESL